jgi:hypothetical protein
MGAEGMWVTLVFVSIALGGASFMVLFLLAILRERAVSTCYWIVSTRRNSGIQSYAQLSGTPVVERPALERELGDDCLKLLENGYHAQECLSGLVAFSVRSGYAQRSWRSISTTRFELFEDH